MLIKLHIYATFSKIIPEGIFQRSGEMVMKALNEVQLVPTYYTIQSKNVNTSISRTIMITFLQGGYGAEIH